MPFDNNYVTSKQYNMSTQDKLTNLFLLSFAAFIVTITTIAIL